MKWVAPIKDEMSIQRICSELEKIDQKYLVLFLGQGSSFRKS